MRTAIAIGAALMLLAAPGGALAKPVKPTKSERSQAAKDCRAERAEIGVDAFREEYGVNRNKRNAFGKCVSRGARAEARERRAERRNAAKDCRAEREEIGVEAFREKYGVNRNKRNALGKCVSQTVRAGDEEPEPVPES
jgi:hypothetical protein